MAAPTYRAHSTFDAATGTVALTKPTGTTDGDYLLAVILEGGGSTADPTTVPSGWTLLDSAVIAAQAKAFAYGKRASSEPGSWTWTFPSSSGIRAFVVAVQHAQGAALDAADVQANPASTNYTAPSVTATEADRLLNCFWFSPATETHTPPAGMTERADAGAAGTSGWNGSFSDQTVATGPTGTRVATGSSSFSLGSFGVSVAVKPFNVAPNAPTLVSPVGGVSINLALTQRLSWTPSDPDPGDTQSKFDLRYRPAAGGAWTDITGTTPNNFYDLPASTLTAGDYEWQVRTYDAQGLVGPYSSSAFFTAAVVSNDITITAPTNGATISTETFTVTWSTPTQTHYQLRVVADLAGAPDTATVIYDTGEIASSSARSRQVSYPDNGVTRHTQVRKKQDGLWSDWASVSNPVSFTTPAVPTIIVDDTSQAGAIQVQATHPTPTGSEPTVSYMDVWRRRAKVDANGNFVEWYDTDSDPGGENGFPHRDGSQLAPTAIFTDWFVNGSGYSYRVRDVGSNGTSSYSEWSDDGSGEVVDEIDGGAPDTVYDDELDGGGP